MKVIKRDGRKVPFDLNKVRATLIKAFSEFNITNQDEIIDEACRHIYDYIKDTEITDVEDIQDEIYSVLRKMQLKDVAKKFRQVRNERHDARLLRDAMNCLTNDLTEDKTTNGNTLSYTCSGKLNNIAESIVKLLAKRDFFSKDVVNAMDEGSIYVHDNGWTLTGSPTCIQIPLDKMLDNGFYTGHGFLRTPSNINTAFQLTAIVLQSSQNDCHGGQAIPKLDFYLAPYVTKTYRKYLKREYIKRYNGNINQMTLGAIENIKSITEIIPGLEPECEIAHADTIRDARQGAEALVHNLNTMSSRAGNQVPFSSLNFGLDTSPEGRVVIDSILKAQINGLGKHETPIFPILIWTTKKGVNFLPEDPNYDLFRLALECSSKRLFPTYCFQDASYTKPYFDKGKPRYTMGCRTTYMTDINGEDGGEGRGNLSFTTINLPYLALQAQGNINRFYKLLEKACELCDKALLQRYQLQISMHPYNFPSLIEQYEYVGTENLKPNDTLEEAFKHGTLSIGFVGLAEALIVLTGSHHGESKEADKIGYDIISFIREYCDKRTQEEKLNYSVLATPAESYCNTALKQARDRFGVIERVTDREYFTNSSHLPVWYECSISKKCEIEGKYHKLENAGHICYIEVDYDISKNIDAYEQILHIMCDNDVGYGAVNIPINECPICKRTFVGPDEQHICPFCGYDEEIGIEAEKSN